MKFLSAAALLLAAACGDTGTPSTKCTSNSNCLTDEVCLTGPGVCTKSCMSQSDCSSASTPSCVAVGSTTVKACQCVDGLNTCGTGKVCSGGACVAGSSNTDAGPTTCTPACTAAQYCDTSGATPTCAAKCTWGSCTTGVCNFATGVCGAPATCVAANAQPDTCNYGKYCGSTGVCAEVIKPGSTCSNFGGAGKMLTWNPATSAGPVIFGITNTLFAIDATFCAGLTNTKRSKVSVKAYTTDSANLFPAAKTGLSNLTRVNSDGTFAGVEPAGQIQDYAISQGGKEVTFTLNSCVANAVTSFSLGLYFTTGNEACFTVN